MLPLAWPYEDEDFNIAIVVADTISYEEARQIETHILDAIADYDEVHGTFTVCMVWREREIIQNGVR